MQRNEQVDRVVGQFMSNSLARTPSSLSLNQYDPDVHGPTQLPRLIRSVSRDIYEAELKNSYLLENPRSKSTRVYYQDQKQPPNQIGKNNYEKSHLNGPEYSQASQSFESSDYGSEGLSKRIERREKKAILDNAAVMRNTTSQHLMSAPTYDEFFSKSEIRYKTLPNPIRENPLDCGVQYKESHNLRRRDSKRKSLVRTVGKMLRKAFFGSHNKPRQYLDINEMNTKQNFLRSASKRSTSNGNLKDAGRDPSVLSQRQSSVRNLQHRLSTKSNRREESSGLTNNYLDYYIPPVEHVMPQTPLLKGIPNLGNTCYINAVLQCLAASDSLMQYIISEKPQKHLGQRTKLQELNSMKHGSNGKLTKALASVMLNMWNNTINQSVMVQFKNIIGDFGNDYRTSNQQDAQEFLIWLLDKVHEDLNTGTQRDTNYNVMRNQSPDDALAERRLSHCSVITSLFEAQLRSSIRCCSCGYQKFIYDPYMFVSLQVPQDLKKTFFVILVNCVSTNYHLIRYGIRVDLRGCAFDMRSCIGRETDTVFNQILLFQMSSDGFQDNITDNTPITSVPGRDVYAVELFPTMKDLMNETINILFCLTIRQGYDITRCSEPFIVLVSRQASYEEIVHRMFEVVNQNVKNSAFSSPPLRELKLYLSNDYHQGGYIEDGVTVPLFTEVVEAQLTMNEKSHPDLPRFIRVAVECPTNTKLLYASGDSITNHVSAECLFKEKTDPDTSIINCLTEFTNEEQLDWRCDKCEKRGGVKRILFRSLPQILIFHLKRFRQVRGGSSNEYESEMVKLESVVQFPTENLDMSQFLCSSFPPKKANNELSSKFGKSIINRQSSSDPLDNIYDLFAVVNHKGERIYTGHYTSTVRNPVDGQWRLFDDTNVYVTDPRSAIHNAYLLFYEKRSTRLTRIHCKPRIESRILSSISNSLNRVGPRERDRTKDHDESRLPRIPNGPIVIQGKNGKINNNFRREDLSRRATTTAGAAAKAGLALPLQTSKTREILPKKETELWF